MNVHKAIFAAIFCFVAAAEGAGGTVDVAPLPAAEYADMEVSTNFPLRVTRHGEGRVNESVSLTIENKKFAVIFK